MEQSQPKNYLVEAILITIFCCQPFGIVGIVYASQVNSKYAIGDYEGALQASKKAKNWTIWGLVIGLIFFTLIILTNVVIFYLAYQSGEFNNL